MKPERNSQTNSSQLEILQSKISELNLELEETKIINQSMWSLLVEITNRLQMSSSAIKAAVSSLLDHDIFWDGSTQHELLEIIDNSADQVSNQIILLSLAFRSEANDLEMRLEPYEIQEIFISVFDSLGKEYPEIELSIDMPSDGNLILVDYKYLTVALELFFDVVAASLSPTSRLKVIAKDTQANWHIDVFEIDDDIAGFISNIASCMDDELIKDISLLPTNKLKLFVVCNIFSLQGIQIESLTKETLNKGLRLILPQVKKTKSDLSD
jgi:K+-sensing histidine kinase KdpD